jgi:hypothetical protein
MRCTISIKVQQDIPPKKAERLVALTISLYLNGVNLNKRIKAGGTVAFAKIIHVVT